MKDEHYNKRIGDLEIKDKSILHIITPLTGGGFVSTEGEANESVSIFRERLNKYGQKAEEEKLDVGYYLAQSGHSLKDEYKRLVIKVRIDEELDDLWHK